MALKHDSHGFLVGDPIELGGATDILSAIQQDTSAIRESLDELLSKPPGAKSADIESSPMLAKFRDEDYPKVVEPKGRGNFGRGHGTEEVKALLSKFGKWPHGPAVVPSRTRANPAISANAEKKASGGVRSASQVVAELKATRLAMLKTVTPTRRDRRGRFASTAAEPNSGAAGIAPESTLRTTTGDVAGRIAGAVRDVLHGAEDVDPSIKAFQEIAGPISRGYELLGGGGMGGRQERWYRRILSVLTGFRKDEAVANKKTEKRLKAIEEKPVTEEGSGGIFGLLLTALTGLGVLLKKIPILGSLLGRIAPALSRILPFMGAATGARAAAGSAAAKPGLFSRIFRRSAAAEVGTAAAGVEGAGAAASAGRLAKFGRFAGTAAKRIPILGSLIGLGLGALGSNAIEGDAGTTRQQKNEAQGRNWGGVGGGLAGAAVGQALIPIPVVGAVIGAVLGEWLGGEAGEIIGSKWTAFTDSLQAGWGTVTDVALGTFDWIKEGWGDFVSFASEKFEAVSKTLTDVFASFSAAVQQRWDEVADATKALVEYARTIPGVAATLDALESARQTAINATTDAMEAAANHWDKMKAGGALLAQDTKAAASSYLGEVKDGAALLGGDISNVAANLVPQGLKDKVEARHEQRLAQERAEAAKAPPSKSVVGRSIQAGADYRQGNIAGLDDVHTRQLVASTAMTESGGGKLGVVNPAGYMGRYQAGAGWLADAGLIKGGSAAVRAAMKANGFSNEYKWGESGGMSRFLKNADNWNSGLSYDKYLASADVQDAAFKRNSDLAYQQLLKGGAVRPDMGQAEIAGLLKARHISGIGGAFAVSNGGDSRPDANGTTARKYFNDLTVANRFTDAFASAPASQAKPDFSNVVASSSPTVSTPAIAVASVPAISPPTAIAVPAAPVTVSLPSIAVPTAPKVSAIEEPVQIQTPMASIPTGGLQNKQGQQWRDVGQDLRERGIAHIVTGGLSSPK